MPTVSIIVPVYNTEKFLNKCIDSILCQSFSNFELILVDDGSSDSSGAICDNYAQKDARVKVIHKENGGVSSARNVGIETSDGEFITFIDSDDDITCNSIENLINKQRQKDFDIVCGNCLVVINGFEVKPYFIDAEYIGRQFIDNTFKILSLEPMMSPWGKLFKRSIIDENKLRFLQGVTYGEDSIFVVEYLEKSRSYATVDEVIYNYNCVGHSSASEKYHENFYLFSKIYTDIVKRIAENNNLSTKELQEYMSTRIKYVLHHYLHKSPGLKMTEINVEKTMDTYKDDVSYDLLENFFSKKEIKLLKSHKYKRFIILWNLSEYRKRYIKKINRGLEILGIIKR